MNVTVARLTASSVLGRRRALALLALPALLVAFAVLVRALAGTDDDLAGDLLGVFALGTLMPLIGLLAGTGAIGPEIDDGSIIYLLAKPIRRSSIILSKLAVAAGTAVAMGAIPVLLAGVLLSGELGRVAIAFTIGALAASLAYVALFLALGVVTRSGVIVGLLYALVWESLIGSIVPGAKALSIQQWSLSIVEAVLGDASSVGVEAAVELRTGLVALIAITVLSTVWATRRLARLHLTDRE